MDSDETNRSKHEQCRAYSQVLREKIEAVKPDVMLIFGDDQYEQFDFSNFPAFGVYMGEEVWGTPPDQYWRRILLREKGIPNDGVRVKGCPELGRALTEALIDRDFDLSFSLEAHNKERGIGHAFINPSYYINPSYDIPVLPFWVNCYYPPQPTGRRCYSLGKAVRSALEEIPLDLKVAVIASGGLWHTPGAPDAYLDETFDRGMIEAMKKGDARGMAELFDETPWEYHKPSAEVPAELARWTGMKGGPGGGTGETRNWLIAAAVADGIPATFAEYVPVYASPIGMAFAYWDVN
jgi:hypothetical protein